MSDALERIARLSRLLIEQQAAVGAAEAALALAKDALRRTEEEDLPQLMREYDLSEVKLTDGSKVVVNDDLRCGISAERRAAAVAWLDANGHGGIVKTRLTFEFGSEERTEALSAAQAAADVLNRDASLDEAVHPSTLKAFLKELAAQGAMNDEVREMFGVQQFSRAKVSAPRANPARKRAG